MTPFRTFVLALSLSCPCVGSAAAQYAQPPSSRALVETTDLSGVSISPDGQRIAYREERASIDRNTYESAWFVRTFDPTVPAVRAADGGPPLRNESISINEPPKWSLDSEWFYYRALIEGEVQIWRASRSGQSTQRLTQDDADIEAFALNPDGTRLVYRVGASRAAVSKAEQAEYERGIHIDSSIHAGRNLFRSHPLNGRLVSPKTFARSSLLASASKAYRTLDLQTLQLSLATEMDVAGFKAATDLPAEVKGARSAVSSADGSRIAVLSGLGGAAEVRVVATQAPASQIGCEPCRGLAITGLAWRGRDELVFTAQDTTRGFGQTLYRWRAGDPRLRRVAASEGLLSGERTGGVSTCAVGVRYAACVSASAAVPPRLERVDLETGARLVLADPNARLAEDVAASSTSELLTWKDAQGRQFTGQLFLPRSRKSGERLPLFITYYVCQGFLRGGYGDEWPLPALSGRGVASLCINHPPINRRDAGADYEAGLAGVSAVVSILDRRGLIDRSRVGMGGLSFGSEVATWIAGHSELLAAVSVANSQPSPTGYWFRALLTNWTDQLKARWGLGAPDETEAQWRRISPARFADSIHAPFLMQMPEAEFRMSMELYVRLVQAGVPVEMWAFPDETHQKLQPRHILAANERNLDWFRFWLQDYVDPSPLKAEQYRRWQAMRSAAPRQLTAP